MHFYKLFELKCVLAVCVHNHPIMIKIHPVFFFVSFFNLIKSFPLSHIKPFSDACLCDVTQTQAPPTIVDWHWCFTLDPPWVSCNSPTAIVSMPLLCPILNPCQIITPLVLVGLGLGVGEGLGLGVGLGLGNQVAISTRGVIIWQGVENGHNTVAGVTLDTNRD